jgi:prepilin peptidase CpaA
VTPLTPQVWISAIVGVAAIVDDVSRRQISNWIPASAFVAGVVLQTIQGGWRGTGAALLGTITGAAVFLIFYLMGGMGGGDVKLMAGFGAVLGWKQLLEAALWTAGCGGLMAAVVIAAGYVRQIWKKSSSVEAGLDSRRNVRANSIPYAPAIAAGVWLSLVPKA